MFFVGHVVIGHVVIGHVVIGLVVGGGAVVVVIIFVTEKFVQNLVSDILLLLLSLV